MSVVEHNLNYQHPYIQRILKHVEELYRMEQDESLEEASKMYKHLARLFNVMAKGIEEELAEVEVHVFG